MCNFFGFIFATLISDGNLQGKEGDAVKSRCKLRGTYFIFNLIVAFVLLILFGIAGVFSGNEVLDSARASLIKQEGEALDNALRLYSQDHNTAFPTGKIDDEGEPITRTYGIYPESISELNYQVRYGYISTLLADALKTWGKHGSNSLVGDFYYEVSEDRRAYLLQARLPNGYIYTTPGSLYTVKDLTGTMGNRVSESKLEWGSSISGKKKN